MQNDKMVNLLENIITLKLYDSNITWKKIKPENGWITSTNLIVEDF